jgi:hypothetical protein
MNEQLYQFISETMLPGTRFEVKSVSEYTADKVDGYLCSVDYFDIKSQITIFVIKSEYNVWLRDKKIDIILE